MNVRRTATIGGMEAIGAIGRIALWVSVVAVGASLFTSRTDLILSTAVGGGLSVFNFRTLAAMLAAALAPEGDPMGGLLVTMAVVAGQTTLFAVAVGMLLYFGLAHGVGLACGLSVIPVACAVWFFTGRHETNENEATRSPNVTKVNA